MIAIFAGARARQRGRQAFGAGDAPKRGAFGGAFGVALGHPPHDLEDAREAGNAAIGEADLRMGLEPMLDIGRARLGKADMDEVPGHEPASCSQRASASTQKAVVSSSEPQCGVSGCGSSKPPSERRARPP